MKQESVKSIKVEFSDEAETAHGGLALLQRLAFRLGLWTKLDKHLPHRRGHYKWPGIIRGAVAGLLTGGRGTVATDVLRGEEPLLSMLGLKDAPEEATFWRSLVQLGQEKFQKILGKVQRLWTREILSRAPRRELFRDGFFPVFGDGTLLEGSERREGTKYLKNKGAGLLWATWFCGPLIAAQQLVGKGESEQSAIRAMLPQVVKDILKPLQLKDKALVLLDSLHGDGPTLSGVENQGLHYVAGANKLAEAMAVLQIRTQWEWLPRGEQPQHGWHDSQVCVCWVQCPGWDKKRLLVGRRWKRYGKLFWEYAGVLTNLTREDVAHLTKGHRQFPDAIWRLYDGKAGEEDLYKDLLEDLNLHHPPCEKLSPNRGFYAVATLAYTLARGVDLIGGKGLERGSRERKDGGRRKRPTPKRMRLWRLCRQFFTLPGRVTVRARQATVTLKGMSVALRKLYEHFLVNICQC